MIKLSLQFFGGSAPDDYPHLNKCPDCETFFADLTCPLCGKICPEEMRAGNRKPPKQKWEDPYSRGSGRVQFVPWYYSTPVIIAMLFIFPVGGLVLLWMGPWKKKWKIFATVLLGIGAILPVIFWALMAFVMHFVFSEDINVDLHMSRTEYVELCEQNDTDVVALFRNPDDYAEDFVKMTVTVEDIFQNYLVEEYAWYYRCTAEVDGREYTFLVRDFRDAGSPNLTPGDRITLYGQVMGNVEVSTYGEELRGPCIAMRFVDLEPATAAIRGMTPVIPLAAV